MGMAQNINRKNGRKTLKYCDAECVSPQMRPPSKVTEPDSTPPYPIETIRFWYVSPFGGRSPELAADEVGVNGEALRRNTELESRDRISVGVSGDDPGRPWFFQRSFEVVPLDARLPQAAGLSPQGEVVLPEGEFDFALRPDLQPRLGDAVVLKGTAAKRLDPDPEWLAEVLRNHIRRPAV